MKSYQDNISNDNKFLLFAIVAYWMVDLVRIQSLLPLASLKLGYVTTGLIFLSVVQQSKKIDINYSIILMIYFALLLWLHVPFARNDRLAFNTSLAFSTVVCFCMCVNAYITSELNVLKIYLILFLIAVFLSGYALLHSGKGPGGFMVDENDIALFINMIIPIGVYLWKINTNSYKWLYLVGVLILLAAEIATRSRGGFVGLAGMSVILIMRSNKKLILIAVLSSVFVVTAILINTYSETTMSSKANYFSAVSSIGEAEDGSSQERLYSWLAAYEMFKDNPLGVGGNNFQIRFPEYQSEHFKKQMWGRVAHSVWFTCLSELGFPGILVLFLILKYNITKCYLIESSSSDYSDVIKPIIYSIIAFICSGTFITAIYYPFIWNVLAIVSGVEKNLPKIDFAWNQGTYEHDEISTK
jgi:O-antigen ligase